MYNDIWEQGKLKFRNIRDMKITKRQFFVTVLLDLCLAIPFSEPELTSINDLIVFQNNQ